MEAKLPALIILNLLRISLEPFAFSKKYLVATLTKNPIFRIKKLQPSP